MTKPKWRKWKKKQPERGRQVVIKHKGELVAFFRKTGCNSNYFFANQNGGGNYTIDFKDCKWCYADEVFGEGIIETKF